jgi:hypothetical protein
MQTIFIDQHADHTFIMKDVRINQMFLIIPQLCDYIAVAEWIWHNHRAIYLIYEFF